MPGFASYINRKFANFIVSHSTIRGYVEDRIAEKFESIAGVSDSGIAVNSETSLKFSAVWNAVRLLSEIPASLPKEVVQNHPDGSFEILKNDPIDSLLHYPNELMSGFDFHELMNAMLQLTGNAVAILIRDRRGIAIEAIPVYWGSVNILFNNKVLIYRVHDTLWNIHGDFLPGDVIHYKLLAYNGLVGRSPIQQAKDNIGLALSAEKYGAEFFRKGGNHKGVIETTTEFKSNAEYKLWREAYDKEHAGLNSNHGVPILQRGMTYKQLTMSMEDAQFIGTRQFSIADIGRWFNLPPHLIGDLSRATFSNIEHQDLQFIKYTLRGLITRQEEEWEFKLIAPDRRRLTDIRFNLDGLSRGDMAARSTYITTMVNGGILLPNEGRAVEGRGPLPEGDKIRIPANIVGNSTNANINQNGK